MKITGIRYPTLTDRNEPALRRREQPDWRQAYDFNRALARHG